MQRKKNYTKYFGNSLDNDPLKDVY